jgi:hypothetical protein
MTRGATVRGREFRTATGGGGDDDDDADTARDEVLSLPLLLPLLLLLPSPLPPLLLPSPPPPLPPLALLQVLLLALLGLALLLLLFGASPWMRTRVAVRRSTSAGLLDNRGCSQGNEVVLVVLLLAEGCWSGERLSLLLLSLLTK